MNIMAEAGKTFTETGMSKFQNRPKRVSTGSKPCPKRFKPRNSLSPIEANSGYQTYWWTSPSCTTEEERVESSESEDSASEVERYFKTFVLRKRPNPVSPGSKPCPKRFKPKKSSLSPIEANSGYQRYWWSSPSCTNREERVKSFEDSIAETVRYSKTNALRNRPNPVTTGTKPCPKRFKPRKSPSPIEVNSDYQRDWRFSPSRTTGDDPDKSYDLEDLDSDWKTNALRNRSNPVSTCSKPCLKRFQPRVLLSRIDVNFDYQRDWWLSPSRTTGEESAKSYES